MAVKLLNYDLVQTEMILVTSSLSGEMIKKPGLDILFPVGTTDKLILIHVCLVLH